jgi:hypothetical protein
MSTLKTYIWSIATIFLVVVIGLVFTGRDDIHIWRLSMVPTPTATAVPTEVPATATIVPTETPSTIPTQTPYPTLTPVPTYTAIPTPTMRIIAKEAVVTSIHSVNKRIFVESIIQVNINFDIDEYIHYTTGSYKVQAGIITGTISPSNITVMNTAQGNIITISGIKTHFIGEPNPMEDTPHEGEPISKSYWKQLGQGIFGMQFLELNDSAQILTAHRNLAIQRACEYGILDYAADNARNVLRGELQNTPGFKFAEINIIVNPGNDCDEYKK